MKICSHCCTVIGSGIDASADQRSATIQGACLSLICHNALRLSGLG